MDSLRGFAIILMVLFHVIFDLRFFFGLKQFNYYEGFWYYEGRVSAILFIVLVGIVTSLICRRNGKAEAIRKNGLRGFRLLGLGMIITLITLVLAPGNTIWFGILHFLGLSILISIPLCRFKWINVILAFFIFIGFFPIQNLNADHYYGLIIGIVPNSFSSMDHYALIPWLGYVLIGLALGNWLYPHGLPILRRPPSLPEKWLAAAGKRSLWIYFIHQPVLLAGLWLYFQFGR